MDQFYDHKQIENKWQAAWEKVSLYQTDNISSEDNFYALSMFPYPSGQGLHVGHPESYTAVDIIARKRRMQGYKVLHPMGWDSFGLPAENFAIKQGVPPWKTTKDNIKNFKKQIKSLGFSYDWSREINTSDPSYYKWTQWLFLQLLKKGLAYKKTALVNWCPSCQTVLANEQVKEGKCERCDHEVVQKDLAQWFFRITDYTEELLSDLDQLDWPEYIKSAQRNWIGKSEGAELEFKIKNEKLSIKIFTTRPDTLFGATYLVLAPEHGLIQKLEPKIKNKDEVKKYIVETKKKSDLQRTDLAKEKSGVKLQGVKAINPASGEEIPIFIADYVLVTYGTGAIMAVPAHDSRDWQFAKKYNLPIREVVLKEIGKKKSQAIRRDGVFGIIVNKKGQVLIQTNKLIGEFRLPGGGIEGNEKLEETLVREIKEEIGYNDISIGNFIGSVKANYFSQTEKEERTRTVSVFLVKLNSESKQNTKWDKYEVLEHDWTESKEAITKLMKNEYFGEAELLRRYIENDYCYQGEGALVNSGEFDGMDNKTAKQKITEKVGGTMKTQYRLRDWLVSRQRYWGAPIPVIYCDKCGIVPVEEKDLPVELPRDVDFKPTGQSPLIDSQKFHNVKCPVCKSDARRESDTMDTFVCSSWYFLRYIDPHNTAKPFDQAKVKKWLPVDLYIGGAEHAVLHLMYSRFITKALRDIGKLEINEPFVKLRNQGMILGEDSQKMSKSRGNVINPDEVVAEFGADSTRLYEMFMGPLEEVKPWSTKGILGLRRFLEKLWLVVWEWDKNKRPDKETEDTIRLFHQTIKKVSEDIEGFKFNTAISAMMILVNHLAKVKNFSLENIKKLLQILHPFAPHITEEIWQSLGEEGFLLQSSWPIWDEKIAADKNITYAIQINGKVKATLDQPVGMGEEEVLAAALADKKIFQHLQNKKIVKKIFVPDKILSFVIKD